jgi:hypothetical protein
MISRFAACAGLAFPMLFSASVVEAGPCRTVACYEKTNPPVVYRTFRNRVVIEPGLYEIARVPSLYGTRKRRVVLHPGETTWHETPGVYKTVTVTKRVAGGYTWEYRTINGREVRCKVKLPARTVTFDKQVLVKRGHRWAERTAPVYGYVEDRVLLRPYKNIAIHHPPYVRRYAQRAAVQPEGYVWRRVRGSAGY